MATHDRIVQAVQEGRTLILGVDLGIENMAWGVVSVQGDYVTSSHMQIVKGQDRHETIWNTLQAFWQQQPSYGLVVNEAPYMDGARPMVYRSQVTLEHDLICWGRHAHPEQAFESITRAEVLAVFRLNTRCTKEDVMQAVMGYGLGSPQTEHEADAIAMAFAARHIVIDACMKKGVVL